MLIRRMGALLALVIGASVATFSSAAPALADEYVVCDAVTKRCYVKVGTPGDGGGPGGGGSGGGGGAMVCREPWGKEVPCYVEGKGWFDPGSFCYWRKLDPQPPALDPRWGGHTATEGVVYHATCPYSAAYYDREFDRFLATPPPGFGGLPSPVTLAAQAISQLPIEGAHIQTAPSVNGAGLVGMQVYLWTEVNASTWGPQTATASVPGLSVTATANAAKIEWRMGDGNSVTCANPGTPYSAEFGGNPSPNCGYVYSQSSRNQPGGRYTITAITTWHVTWAGGGQTGALDVTRQSTSTVQIQELSVVTR